MCFWGEVFFPNETSFWETPLRIKEKASDRWGNWISGPNPDTEFGRARVQFFSCAQVFLCTPQFFHIAVLLVWQFFTTFSWPLWWAFSFFSSAPAAGCFQTCFLRRLRWALSQNVNVPWRLRRALFQLIYFGACGGSFFN